MEERMEWKRGKTGVVMEDEISIVEREIATMVEAVSKPFKTLHWVEGLFRRKERRRWWKKALAS